MSKKKTDYEQLKGILKEFDDETVFKVLREQELDTEKLQQPMIKYTKDFPDKNRGPRSKEGDKNVVSREDYLAESKIERIITVTGEEPDFLPVHFLECGWNFSKPVARVKVGFWWGSGFLVSRSLFMTNNHVIHNEAEGRIAEAEFNYQLDHDANPTPKDTFHGDPDSFFHTNPSLDYTIMRLKPHRIYNFGVLAQDPWRRYFSREQSLEELNLGSVVATAVGRAALYLSHHAGDSWGHIPLVDKAMAVEQRINIIQHPRTRYKEVCLHDNRITEIFANAIHYTTDTENGSSGSPVFDNEWELLAIHHAAGDYHAGQWIDNEGMRIDSIIDDLQNSLRGTSDEGVLTELGIP